MSNQLFESPNLDNLSTDPADYEEAAIVLTNLSRYASFKAVVMRNRLCGRIDIAQKVESMMGVVYNELPKWAKW